MEQGTQRATPMRAPLLLLLILCAQHVRGQGNSGRGDKKFGDKCRSTWECGFDGSVCDEISGKCLCNGELPVTNHLDKCGVAAKVNESCFFNEQCETVYYLTECRDGVCTCRFQRQAVIKADGSVECKIVETTSVTPGTYIDPAMIGILVAMFLMFITICVVLRLFSKARWRENRTIFNTPNPRLMNVSLLRDNKHPERRGSKTSGRGPSRQPSMASIRPHSPNSQGCKSPKCNFAPNVYYNPTSGHLFLGSRRGSNNASATSIRSNKSPPSSAATPMLESVTVEVQEPKA